MDYPAIDNSRFEPGIHPMIEAHSDTDRRANILDCGHTSTPTGYGIGTGVACNADGRTMCYSCADDSIRADIANGEVVTLYDSGERPQRIGLGTMNWTVPQLTSWTGGQMMTVVRRERYRHNFGGWMAAVTAIDSNGRYWHGRHSADNCDCVTMRRSTVGA